MGKRNSVGYRGYVSPRVLSDVSKVILTTNTETMFYSHRISIFYPELSHSSTADNERIYTSESHLFLCIFSTLKVSSAFTVLNPRSHLRVI